MGLFSSLFGGNRSKGITEIDRIYVEKLSIIELELRDRGDFYGMFFDEERSDLLNYTESSIPNVVLGLIYFIGINVKKDNTKAEGYFLTSIQIGAPYGYKYLAIIELEKGNKGKAQKYLNQAIKSGETETEINDAINNYNTYLAIRGITISA